MRDPFRASLVCKCGDPLDYHGAGECAALDEHGEPCPCTHFRYDSRASLAAVARMMLARLDAQDPAPLSGFAPCERGCHVCGPDVDDVRDARSKAAGS